jgi:hypothetical protein
MELYLNTPICLHGVVLNTSPIPFKTLVGRAFTLFFSEYINFKLNFTMFRDAGPEGSFNFTAFYYVTSEQLIAELTLHMYLRGFLS